MRNEPTIPKRKNKSPLHVIVNAWGCLLGLVMLGLGAIVGFAGAIVIAPNVLGYFGTATAQAEYAFQQDEYATRLAETQQRLQLRETDLLFNATNQAMQARGTQEALDYEGVLLDQTATQSQQRIYATQTANVVISDQLRTQNANNATSTQNAILQQATVAAQEFRLTEDALNNQSGMRDNGNALAVAQGAPSSTASPMRLLPPTNTPTQQADVAAASFAAQSVATSTPTDAPVPDGIIPPPSDTPIHTATSAVFEAQSVRATSTPRPFNSNNTSLLPASDTPMPTPERVEDTFTLEWIESSDWQTNTDDAWADAEDDLEGVTVERANAWLLYNSAYTAPYRINLTFAPAIVLESEYFLIFGLDENEGYAVYLHNEGLAAKKLALYRFDRRLLDDQLLITEMEELATLDLDMLLRSKTTLSLIVADGQVTLSINEQSLLLHSLDDALSTGQMGLQVPQGTILHDILIESDMSMP